MKLFLNSFLPFSPSALADVCKHTHTHTHTESGPLISVLRSSHSAHSRVRPTPQTRWPLPLLAFHKIFHFVDRTFDTHDACV